MKIFAIVLALLTAASTASAEVKRIVIDRKVSPAFDGRTYGTVGAYGLSVKPANLVANDAPFVPSQADGEIFNTISVGKASMPGYAHQVKVQDRWAIVAYTAVALVGIGWNGWSGYRRHRLEAEPLPHDLDTPGDRHRFLGFATLLLAALSAVATVFAATVVVFFEDCR